MTSSPQSSDGSAIPRYLRVGASLVGVAFLFLAAVDFFIAHPPFTTVQLVVKVYLGLSGLILVTAGALRGAQTIRFLRPALLSAFAFLGLVAAGLVYRLTLSLVHADRMAPFLLSLLVPASAVGCFAFFIWHRLKPTAI